jgi:hypothetical protein
MTREEHAAWVQEVLRSKEWQDGNRCLTSLLNPSLVDSDEPFPDTPKPTSPQVESWRLEPHFRYHR